jgi:hypothetical protein
MAQQEQKANGQTDEETFTPVGPGATDQEKEAPAGEGQQEAAGEPDDEEETRDDRRAGHSDDEEDDANLPPEIRAKRERRRAERKQRKEQYRRDQTELTFLRRRNEDLERRFSTIEQRQTGTEQMTIDSRIAQIDDQIRLAEQIHGQAVEKGDGNSATEALRIRDELIEGKRSLAEAKRRAAATAGRPTGWPRPDPEIANRAREWISQNSWYDPQLRDPDSRVAKTIEEGLYREGRLDPRSNEYWEEYDRRLSKYLPEKVKPEGGSTREDDEEDETEERQPLEKPQKQRGNGKPAGPTFRTGGRERSLKKGEVYISAERRKAMEEMGVWEDPVLRNRYLKAYARYDTEVKSRRSNS